MNILEQLIFAEMGKIAGPKIMMKQVWRFDVVFRIYELELPVQAEASTASGRAGATNQLSWLGC